MTAVVRKFDPLNGRLPPAGRFYLDYTGQVKLILNCQAVEKFGVGIEFRSADLYHSRDPDNDEEQVILELFREAYKGQVMLSYQPQTKITRLAITKFVRQMEIASPFGVRCPLWLSGSTLYLELVKSA